MDKELITRLAKDGISSPQLNRPIMKEEKMKKQELVEKIVKTLELADDIKFSSGRYILPISLKEKILDVETNINPKTGRPFIKFLTPLERTKVILVHIKEAGYVNLADDQSLPEGVGNCMDCNDSNKMLRAGWRKVEVKDGN